MPGIWGLSYKHRHYELKNREVLATNSAGLIKVLEADPEIMSFKDFNKAYPTDEQKKADEKKREEEAAAKKAQEAEEVEGDPGEDHPRE